MHGVSQVAANTVGIRVEDHALRQFVGFDNGFGSHESSSIVSVASPPRDGMRG
jgi:hypothetical protein